MDVYTTGVLVRVVQNLKTPPSFLLDRFFQEEQTETGEEIHFDVDDSKPRITPFVHPTVAGKVVENEGYATKTFRPAYAKDKRRFQPDAPLKRSIGEQIGGTLDPQQRRNISLRRAMENQLEMLTRRLEVMASEALREGQVTVSGEGYDTVVVDFGRATALSVTISDANDRWDNEASDPPGDIEAWADLIMNESGGVATDVVMAPNVSQAFRQHAAVKELLDTRRGSESTLELGPQLARKARFLGFLGEFRCWSYNDKYIDDAGQTQDLMPAGTVILGSPQIEGVRAFGSIQDEAFNYQALAFAPKSWLEEDPAVRWLLMQSAPLVVPYRVNASLRATVLA